MSSAEFDAEAYVAAAAPAMGLDLTAEQKAGVVQFLRTAASMAKIVESAPVDPDSFNLAPVFRPGRPA
jgi:hypothetical protein